jgi:ribonuclease T2
MISFFRIARVAAAGALLAGTLWIGALLSGTAAFAQDRRQNAPGEFDFYVLALSWSPSFCEAGSERGNTGRSHQMQCGGGRPFAFVVHGLWPQYERGFPDYCQRPAPRLNRGIVSSMLDIMPAPGLVFNQWDKHGTCSGLSPRAYFETIRKARAGVKIPEEYIDLPEAKTVSPAEVEEAFIRVNPGLSAAAIAVNCDSKRLSEIRICLSRDLQFRACEEIDRRACRRDRLVMPPVRGG